jgi:hypothetical protein
MFQTDGNLYFNVEFVPMEVVFTSGPALLYQLHTDAMNCNFNVVANVLFCLES